MPYEGEVIKEGILLGGKALENAPELKGVSTGIEGLDNLFYTFKESEIVSLNGIPQYSVFNITGVSDTGKSLLVEQFAVYQAKKGDKVAFVTVETPANFLVSSLRFRANAMGFNFKEFENNIIFIDAASYSSLRDNIPNLLNTLAFAIKEYKIKFTVIDSVTGLYENKEMTARVTVRKLYNFMKKWYQTALFVSQKRSSHEELSAEAAGGFAVGHIVDGTMVLAKEVVSNQFVSKLYNINVGEIVRLFRIDGCRMCGHDTKTHFMEITNSGLIRILNPVGE